MGLLRFQKVYDRARRDAHGVKFGRGTTYFLGNSAAHAVSVYNAAKVYELLGTKAHAEALEEFSHLELFTLRGTDHVNVRSCFDTMRKGETLRDELTRGGYSASLIKTYSGSPHEQLFHGIFVAQLSVLKRAETLGLSEPRFLNGKERLRVSDAMIY